MNGVESNLSEIAKVLGGLFAFAAVIYVGALFFRRESNFAGEYGNIITQYKLRNEELQIQIEEMDRDHHRDLAEMRAKYTAEITLLKNEIINLQAQIDHLKKMMKK